MLQLSSLYMQPRCIAILSLYSNTFTLLQHHHSCRVWLIWILNYLWPKGGFRNQSLANHWMLLSVCFTPFLALWSPKCPIFKWRNLEICWFSSCGYNFHSAVEPKVLKLEGSSFGNRPTIYVWMGWYDGTSPPPKKRSYFGGNSIFIASYWPLIRGA